LIPKSLDIMDSKVLDCAIFNDCNSFQELWRGWTPQKHGLKQKQMDTGCIVLAAASGKLKTVKFLLEHGVDPNSKMMPASILIIGIRPWTRLGVLLAKIDRDMSQFTRGWAPALTAACLAAFYDHSDVLGCLFTGGADPEYDPYIKIGEDFDSAPSWNPVLCAIYGKNIELSNMLMDMGFDVPATARSDYWYEKMKNRRALSMANVLLYNKVPEDLLRVVQTFF